MKVKIRGSKNAPVRQTGQPSLQVFALVRCFQIANGILKEVTTDIPRKGNDGEILSQRILQEATVTEVCVQWLLGAENLWVAQEGQVTILEAPTAGTAP